MRNRNFFWIIVSILVLLDLYIYQVIKVVSHSASHRTRLILFTCYWTISGAAILLLALMPALNVEKWGKATRAYVFAVLLGLFFAKFIAVVFFLIDDIRRLLQWAAGKLFFARTEADALNSGGISRSIFLSWVGLIAGGGLFGTLVYGFKNKYNYEVRRLKLSFSNLPPAFKGLKIVQISDIHSGSFTNKEAVAKGVVKIMEEKPDLILFTGDLVNDMAIEMHDYMDVFNKLSAPMGVFSTLGNHDYGDYHWGHSPVGEKAIEKANSLKRLKEIHGEMGWRLLMDEHVPLERGGQQIALIGVQNISAKARFFTYGDMKKAYEGTEKYPFKILMSHDPSHWDGEVRPKYPDVDLMLAGHTHGMQFGIEIPGFKWSPVQYVYKQWAGLYEEGKQKLYVNRGYGFIGYPGRVGIMPEITVFELV